MKESISTTSTNIFPCSMGGTPHSLVLGDSVACLERFCYCLTILESTNGATWPACFLFLSECSLSSCDSPTLLCWAGRPQSSTLSLSSGAKGRSILHVLCPKLLILCCLAAFQKEHMIPSTLCLCLLGLLSSAAS